MAAQAEQEAATEDYLQASTAEEVRAAVDRAQAAAVWADSLRGKSGPGTMDMSGQRYGSLLAEARGAPQRPSVTRWLCICDCGSRVVVRAQALRQGWTACLACRAAAQERGRAQRALLPQSARQTGAGVPAPEQQVRAALLPTGNEVVLRALGAAMRRCGSRWPEVAEVCGDGLAEELQAAEMQRRGAA